VNRDDLPYADGNPALWKGSPKVQLKEAVFEIVCFDSGATLLIGAPGEIGAQFKAVFTEARALD
jgi:hypothetical protein